MYIGIQNWQPIAAAYAALTDAPRVQPQVCRDPYWDDDDGIGISYAVDDLASMIPRRQPMRILHDAVQDVLYPSTAVWLHRYHTPMLTSGDCNRCAHAGNVDACAECTARLMTCLPHTSSTDLAAISHEADAYRQRWGAC